MLQDSAYLKEEFVCTCLSSELYWWLFYGDINFNSKELRNYRFSYMGFWQTFFFKRNEVRFVTSRKQLTVIVTNDKIWFSSKN